MSKLSAGFGLIETLLALALLAGLMTAAAPVLATWSIRLRLAWASHTLLLAMSQARIEAARRGSAVVLCRRDERQGCSQSPRSCGGYTALGNDWACGWLLIAGGSKTREGRMMGGRIIRTFAAPRGVRIVASGAVAFLTFRPPVGQAIGQLGRFTISPAAPELRRQTASSRAVDRRMRRCIVVNIVGNARLDEDAAVCA